MSLAFLSVGVNGERVLVIKVEDVEEDSVSLGIDFYGFGRDLI